MITVNRYWLDDIWAPISEGKDVDAIQLVDMDCVENLTVLAEAYIKPYFHRIPKEVAKLLKDTWRYAIYAYDDDQLESSVDSVLPPFVVPPQVKQFYINVWNATFPGESWEIVNADEYRDLYNPDLWVWNYATWHKRSSFN